MDISLTKFQSVDDEIPAQAGMTYLHICMFEI